MTFKTLFNAIFLTGSCRSLPLSATPGFFGFSLPLFFYASEKLVKSALPWGSRSFSG
jgi:hypothetical protein